MKINLKGFLTGLALLAVLAPLASKAQDAGYYAQQTYTSTGAATYAVPFPYAHTSDIEVFDNGALYTGAITFPSTSILSLSPVINAGDTVIIRRGTSVVTPAATFTGGALASASLNANVTQELYAAQEARDQTLLTSSQVSTATANAAAAAASAAAAQSSATTAATSAGTAVTTANTALAGVNGKLTAASNLSDLTSPSSARSNLGLGALATEANPTSSQVTTGLGYTPLSPANNLSDLASPATARTNLGLGALATQANPTSAQTIAGLGYTPVPNTQAATSTVLGLVKPDGSTIANSGGALSVTYGSSAGSAAQGNDARFLYSTVGLGAFRSVALPAGVDCTGAVDATTYLTAAAAYGGVIIPTGCTIKLSSTQTITVPVEVLPGGHLIANTGATITFAGGFDAPLSQVLSGAGTFLFSPGIQPSVHPEWWYNGTDYLPALNAAAGSGCLFIALQNHDYNFSSTWYITESGITVRGPASRSFAPNQVARLIVSSATADAVQMGLTSDPGTGPNYFASAMEISNVLFTRTVSPTGSTITYTGGAGLRVQFCLGCLVQHTASAENNIGYAMGAGIVNSFYRDNWASRSLGSSFFVGFYYSPTAFGGAVQGNASLYMNDNHVSVGGTPTLSSNIGLAMTSGTGWFDTVVDKLEASGVAIGVELIGPGNTGTAANGDVHLHNIVIDQYTTAGYIIQNTNLYSAIDISDSYAAPAPNSAGATSTAPGFFISGILGSLKLTDNQILCFANNTGPSTGTAIGEQVISSSGLDSKGNTFVGCARPVVLTSSNGNSFRDTITNPSGSPITEQPVYMTGSSNNYFNDIIQGATTISAPYYMDSASTYDEFHTAMVNTTAYPATIDYNGTSIVASPFGTGNIDPNISMYIGVVAGLPSAVTAGVGAAAYVTNSSTATPGGYVAGGGTVYTIVHSNGANWIVG